ncbi:MAG: MerR family transcriptional regulator [Sphaerochaetaceae bacterium]|nr:MerR family transcriptional regulator [Sphaerochaetaceae bacterium]MDC7236238.1 MerR family transcriptional regulator [Sphaerochaetaceae bacterium]MDC7248759.1 MerR family transcriptional regulator [Sphaerochaetaceae bacterium]
MQIKEVAKLVNISVRTLHYYDEIDLLNPKKINSSGYRIYDEDSLKKLQQIMFLKELDFSLKEIKAILDNDKFDYNKAFLNHKSLLVKKRDRLNKLINLLDKYIEGENKMSFKEFDNSEIEKAKKEYEAEVIQRWGNTKAYKQSKEKTSTYTKEHWKIIQKENKEIFDSFARIKEKSPASKEAQELVIKWKEFINKYYYDCDNTMLESLAHLYISDERFKKNIDKHGENTAQFICDSILHFVKN